MLDHYEGLLILAALGSMILAGVLAVDRLKRRSGHGATGVRRRD